MTILLLGSSGQIGGELIPYLIFESQQNVLMPSRKDLDLENPDLLFEYVRNKNPSLVINAAGYTNVDKAEEEPEKAELLNVTVPWTLAKVCNEINASLVHYSTDYVFDGKKGVPYLESDDPSPINAYGMSKFNGEQKIIAENPNCIIFRTSWVYSVRRSNFLLTMCDLLDEYVPINVVYDQVGTPNSAEFIAKSTFECIKKDLMPKNGTSLVHLVCSGQASWYEFALAIRELIGNAQHNEIVRQTTEEYVKKVERKGARRPEFSVLDSTKAKDMGLTVPTWEDDLKSYVEKYTKER